MMYSETAVHTLDLLSYLAGTIRSVSACINNFSLRKDIEVEDTIMAYLRFDSELTGIFFKAKLNLQFFSTIQKNWSFLFSKTLRQ
ncbi:MAG: Gfo/Idh/MocA family oxidoreductase [Oliverpabstia sp.]